MKPAYVGLMVLLATAALVLFAFLAFPVKPMSAFVEPSGASGATKSTRRETKTTQRKTTTSGGVFSGSDPSDPRVYH
ncbi:MAG TPA: hypothetical protein VGM43_16080 [Bryobacteraceae bacterium]|jgi:hypothetical protein